MCATNRRRLTAHFAASFGLIALFGIASTGLAAPGNEGVERSVLGIINAERQAHRLPPVLPDKELHQAAQWMAEDLARQNRLDHTDSQRRDMADRLRSFGYPRPRVLAENIAEGHENPQEVVKSWLQSTGHRANILNREVSEAGVGHARNADGENFWVLDLGTSFQNP